MARKILLADDSVTAQNMGRRILSDAGYEVVTVNNGSAALKKISEEQPDLLVLDVYMPGYSGLEVCQRIKAGVGTASVPVLLTVGKLEPFKAEEARKVFADAFIVKPFEATELLTVLTKLEEKIVPQPDAKPAPSKASAARESTKKSQQEDPDWKDRLRIQAPAVQVEEPQPQEIQAAPEEIQAPLPAPESSTKFHDIRHEIAAAETDEAIAANLPEAATSEELAAITAAVSAFAAREDITQEAEGAEEEEAEASEAVQDERGETAESGGPETEVPVVEAVAEVDSTEAETQEPEESLQAISPWANPQLLEEVAAAMQQEPHAELVPQTEEPAKVQEPETLTESEVDAALAALGTVDIMARLQAEEQAHVRSLDRMDKSAAQGWTPQATVVGATRWIAEEMKLEEHEAALVLEEEMQGAREAQLRAEEEARAALEQVQAPEETYASPSAAAEEAPATVEAISTIEVQESEPVAEVAQAAPVSQVAEPVESAAIASSPAQVEEVSSYAAAAAASGGPAPAVIDAPQATPAEPAFPESRKDDPELAAAWARWKQIRESVASPQFVSQVADVATAQLQDTQQKEAQTSPEPAPAPDAKAIANIVDSVLAQLKPKLVEEIAKQLSEKK